MAKNEIMNTGIVVSLYNKENEIDKKLISHFLESVKNIHLCVVNNGSTDGTLEALNQVKAKYPDKLSVVSIRNKKGIESALKVGFRYLMNHVTISKVSFSNQLNFEELKIYSEFSNKFNLKI